MHVTSPASNADAPTIPSVSYICLANSGNTRIRGKMSKEPLRRHYGYIPLARTQRQKELNDIADAATGR